MAFANFTSHLAVLLTILITLNYAGPYLTISLGRGVKKGGSIVSFSLVAGPQQLPITRRDDYVDIQLINPSVFSYFIELLIGSPPQMVKVQVDTSVSSLWVSAACDPDSACDPSFGNYTPQKSASSYDHQENTIISYVDGNVIEVEYYTDTYALSTGINVKDVEFGVAISTSLTNGILGLGFPESDDQSPTLIAQFASQRITNSKAFSLALSNASTTDGGLVIFGGVDTKKFSGSLSVNKITTDSHNDYTIEMDGVGVGTLGGDSIKNLTTSYTNVTISSGFGSSYLPDSIIEILSEYFNARVNDDLSGRYGLPCAMAANSSSFKSFYFASVAIEIPLSALVLPGRYDLCEWALQSNTRNEGNSVLGIQFLQYAYTVFDQTLMTVSLAQYVNCGTHVQEIQSYGVDNFVGECPPARAVTPANNSSSTPSSPGPDTSSSPPFGLSSGAKAGIGVGVVVGAIAVAALVYFILVAKRRRQANNVRESQYLPHYKPHPDMMEQPPPNEVLHEMHTEQSPSALSPVAYTQHNFVNEALGSLHNEVTGYTWTQSTKSPSHSHPMNVIASEMPEGRKEADIAPREIGELP
ncbi:aspartic peptidase domain-containing protein [Xylaria arbuscula]|nr:aspartic peptidase domain-containing protein [Xylaria arbuscula]